MKHQIFAAAAILAAALSTEAKAEQNMDHQAIIDTVTSMTTAFAAGNIDDVMNSHGPRAVVVAAPGQPVAGEARLREMFAEFVARGVNFTYGAHEVVVAGDTGLHLMSWTAPGPNGPMTALSVAVLKRQPNGSWKMVIDHPFGDGVMHRPK